MKRCPECEFLYDNESTRCDMDGTPLRYTVALPSLPGLARSIWDKWTIAMLCAVVLGTVLVILYRATPPALSEASAGQMKLQPEPPAATQTTRPPETAGSPSESPADAPDGSSDSRDPFESQTSIEAKTQKSKRASLTADEKESTPASVTHIEAASNPQTVSTSSMDAKPAMTKTSGGEVSVSQTPASSAAAAVLHPKHPDTVPPKAGTPEQKKDSGVKSFFKKAGKVLKKPFGEN